MEKQFIISLKGFHWQNLGQSEGHNNSTLVKITKELKVGVAQSVKHLLCKNKDLSVSTYFVPHIKAGHRRVRHHSVYVYFVNGEVGIGGSVELIKQLAR